MAAAWWDLSIETLIHRPAWVPLKYKQEYISLRLLYLGVLAGHQDFYLEQFQPNLHVFLYFKSPV